MALRDRRRLSVTRRRTGRRHSATPHPSCSCTSRSVYALRGVDPLPTRHDQYLVFTERDGHTYLAGDDASHRRDDHELGRAVALRSARRGPRSPQSRPRSAGRRRGAAAVWRSELDAGYRYRSSWCGGRAGRNVSRPWSSRPTRRPTRALTGVSAPRDLGSGDDRRDRLRQRTPVRSAAGDQPRAVRRAEPAGPAHRPDPTRSRISPPQPFTLGHHATLARRGFRRVRRQPAPPGRP